MKKFATIAAVTDDGYGLTPSAVTPWSAANTYSRGRAGAATGNCPRAPA